MRYDNSFRRLSILRIEGAVSSARAKISFQKRRGMERERETR